MTFREWLYQITEPGSHRIYKTKAGTASTVSVIGMIPGLRPLVLVRGSKGHSLQVSPMSLYFPDNPECIPVEWEA